MTFADRIANADILKQEIAQHRRLAVADIHRRTVGAKQGSSASPTSGHRLRTEHETGQSR
jgi:hypothetical protein